MKTHPRIRAIVERILSDCKDCVCPDWIPSVQKALDGGYREVKFELTSPTVPRTHLFVFVFLEDDTEDLEVNGVISEVPVKVPIVRVSCGPLGGDNGDLTRLQHAALFYATTIRKINEVYQALGAPIHPDNPENLEALAIGVDEIPALSRG